MSARLSIGVASMIVLAWQIPVFGQPDDFNDGDDLGWTRVDYSTQGGPAATFTLTNGTYRLYYLISSNQMAAFGFPRMASYRNESYGDFYLQVDLLDWERQSVGYAVQGFGLMARAQPDMQTNGLSGYIFLFEPNLGIDHRLGEWPGAFRCQTSARPHSSWKRASPYHVELD